MAAKGRPRGAAAQRRLNPAIEAQQTIDCYELKLSGMTHRQISSATGLALGTVSKRIQSSIDARVQPLAEELRAIEVDRLDRWLRKLDAQIEADIHVARNVEVATKVSERRCKLLGLDPPERIEAMVTEVTQEDIALAELVRDAQAAAAIAESALRDTV